MKENFAETMRHLAAAWRNMSEQEKDRYRQQSAAGGGSKTSKTRHSSHSDGATAARHRRSTAVSLASSCLIPRRFRQSSSAIQDLASLGNLVLVETQG